MREATVANQLPQRCFLVQVLEQLWQQGQQPDPFAFLESAGPCSPAEVAAVLTHDQWRCWQAGNCVAAEEYLRRCPALAGDPDAALEVIFGEFLVRQALGERPQPAEYLNRFPQFVAPLGELFGVGLANTRHLPNSSSQLDSMLLAAAGAPPEVPGYKILGEVGRGGMGVVYKALQHGLQRTVALKMILDGLLSNERAVQRFYQEARAAAALDHPNIVPIYEINQHAGRHYFTMAFIEGTNLREAVQKNGLQPPLEAVALLIAVADAVAHAHAQGIIHRDLKPDNVLLDRQGRPRVVDFGVAKCQVRSDAGLTATGQLLGTPSYMAPEQAQGRDSEIGPAIDGYALGGILYFLLTGRPPFAGSSLTETLLAVIEQPPVPPRQHNPQAPAELEAICLKCLQKAPADRYPSVAALAEELRRYASSHMVTIEVMSDPGRPLAEELRPYASGQATPARSAAWSPRVWAGVLGAAAVLAMAVGGAVVWVAQRPALRKEVADPGSQIAERSAVSRAADAPEDSALPVADLGQIVPVKPARRDFGLKVELVGSTPGPDGERQLVEKQEVAIRIQAERDAYVGVWSIAANGTILMLFPNQWEEDNRIPAGQVRTVPAINREDYALEARLSQGAERVWAVALTVPWNIVPGEREGPWIIFKKAADRERWQREQRDIVFKAAKLRPGAAQKVELSEEIITYRVCPAEKGHLKEGPP